MCNTGIVSSHWEKRTKEEDVSQHVHRTYQLDERVYSLAVFQER